MLFDAVRSRWISLDSQFETDGSLDETLSMMSENSEVA
jgi:hypothetical protein